MSRVLALIKQGLYKRAIIVGVGFAVGFLVIEFLLHIFALRIPHYFERILSLNVGDLGIRLFWVVLFFVLGVMYFLLNRKIEIAEKNTQVVHDELAQIVNTAADGMLVVDMDYNITLINDTLLKIIGVSRKSIVGKKCYDVFDGPTCVSKECPINRIVAGDDRVELDVNLKNRSNRDVPCILTVVPYTDTNGNIKGVVEYFKDVSSRKRKEKERQRTEKLESLGLFAGGIAHDFKNILSIILIDLGLIKKYSKEGKTQRLLARLQDAEGAVDRAHEFIQKLLDFARDREPELEKVSLQPLLREMSLFSLRGSNVICDCRVPAELWKVIIDKSQVMQVIQNLVINAGQAMPKGGTVKIFAENVVYEKGMLGQLKKGNYVRIVIKDQGLGIPDDELPRIFDPFYTTKKMGTGLGLSIAYSIIKNHNGDIKVLSQPGEGSSFDVYLPAAS